MRYGEEITVLEGFITVRRRSDDYMAFLTGDERIWGCGKTVNESIGSVVSAHPDYIIAALQGRPKETTKKLSGYQLFRVSSDMPFGGFKTRAEAVEEAMRQTDKPAGYSFVVYPHDWEDREDEIHVGVRLSEDFPEPQGDNYQWVIRRQDLGTLKG